MKLEKCPRCDLNYILDGGKYCSVCMREIKGDAAREEVELCSVCNQEPALPGKDVCAYCLKEMEGEAAREEQSGEEADGVGLDGSGAMDEMIPEMEQDDIPGELENELSLESVREEEDMDEEEEEDQ